MHALYVGERDRGESLLATGRETVFEAAAFGRVARLDELLSEQPELVRSWSDDGFTPLHTAAQNGDTELVRLFLEHGADTRAAGSDGRTPADLAPAGTWPEEPS